MGSAPSRHVIEKISPTMAIALLGCPLRVAFSRDERTRGLSTRPKPAAILGSASHAPAEDVARGAFDDIPAPSREEALRTRWDAFVDAGRNSIDESELLGVIPAVSRWPF